MHTLRSRNAIPGVARALAQSGNSLAACSDVQYELYVIVYLTILLVNMEIRRFLVYSILEAYLLCLFVPGGLKVQKRPEGRVPLRGLGIRVLQGHHELLSGRPPPDIHVDHYRPVRQILRAVRGRPFLPCRQRIPRALEVPAGPRRRPPL